MTFKEWLFKKHEEFGQGPTGALGAGQILWPQKTNKMIKKSKTIVMPRGLEQDRHTADRLDPGSQ